MEYALIIWTVIGVGANASSIVKERDWRPIAVFYHVGSTSALEMCNAGAAQLNIKPENYRCVRTK